MSGIIFYVIYFDDHLLLETKENNSSYTFVTAFFSFSKKKHPNSDYLLWMKSFFRIISSNVFIFSDEESSKLIPSSRDNIILFESIYEIPCIKRYKYLYKNQSKIDPERNKVNHSMELYMMWNAKICLLKIITERYNASVYIWIDIGSFRKKYFYTHFPSLNVINYLSKLNTMFFFVVKNKNFKRSYTPKLALGDFIEGGSFGGNKELIQKYYDIFWKVHDYFLYEGEFVGKDQTLYNTVAIYYMKNISLFPMYGYFKCWNNKWYRYINFYAGEYCALIKETNILSYIN